VVLKGNSQAMSGGASDTGCGNELSKGVGARFERSQYMYGFI
jgi:hypothetical protein